MNSIRLIVGVMGLLIFATTAMGALINGDMESFTGEYPSQVATGWTSYRSGTNTNYLTYFSETLTGYGHNDTNCQKIKFSQIRDDRAAGIYQAIPTTPGDALAFSGWAWCNIRYDGANGVQTSLRANWDGDTNPDSADMVKIITRDTVENWYGGGPSNTGGNATGTSVMLFLHAVGNDNNIDVVYVRWDDITVYHAHVPDAATLGGETASSLDFDVNPGDNWSGAEYAVKISGGSLTGDNWVQTDGTIGSTKAWQTDTVWGNQTVLGLDAMTEYTFELTARYDSGTHTSTETWLGTAASASTTPEPTALALLALGLPWVVRRRRR